MDIVEIFILLFADDVILVSDTVVGLQNQMNILEYYTNKCKLFVNFKKTNIVILRRGGPVASKEKWFLNGKTLSVVDHYTYLGMFSHIMNFKKSVIDLKSGAKKALINVMSVSQSFGILSSTDYALWF